MCYETAFEDVLGKGVGCCHAMLWVENLKLLGLRDRKTLLYLLGLRTESVRNIYDLEKLRYFKVLRQLE